MWHDRPAKFLERVGIQSEQERRSALSVQDDCEDHAFVFARCCRRRYEHRLAGICTILEPRASPAAAHIDLHQFVHKVTRPPSAHAVGVLILAGTVAPIIDPGQLQVARRQDFMTATVLLSLEMVAPQFGCRYVYAVSQVLQVVRFDDAWIRIGADVEHDVVSPLERVDMMKREESISLMGRNDSAIVLAHDPETCAAFGLPSEVLDERPTREQ